MTKRKTPILLISGSKSDSVVLISSDGLILHRCLLRCYHNEPSRLWGFFYGSYSASFI